MRMEALEMLDKWAKPSGATACSGCGGRLPERTRDAAEALRVNLAGTFKGSDGVRSRAGQVAADLGIKEVIPEDCGRCWPTSRSLQKRGPTRLPRWWAGGPGGREHRAGGHRGRVGRGASRRRNRLAGTGAADAVALLSGRGSFRRTD